MGKFNRRGTTTISATIVSDDGMRDADMLSASLGVVGFTKRAAKACGISRREADAMAYGMSVGVLMGADAATGRLRFEDIADACEFAADAATTLATAYERGRICVRNVIDVEE